MIASTDDVLAGMRDAAYLVRDVADVPTLRAAGLTAAHAASPADVADAVRGASIVVVVDGIDNAMTEHVALLRPAAEVRSVALPPGCASVCAMLGVRGADVGRPPPWDADAADVARTTWIDWCAEQSLPLSHGDAGDWVPFPVAELPPWLRAIVEQGAAAQGVDPAYWAVPMLGILAGCVGATRCVRLSRDWREPAVVWAAIIAPSGAGKSPPLRALLRPVADHDYRLHLRTVAAQQQYATDVDAHKAAKGDAGPRPEPPPMLAALLGDATLEAALARLADNPRGLLLCVDELAGFLRSFDRYRKGGDAQQWLSIHNADAAKVDRKGTGTGAPTRLYVRHAAVSVAGTIQPGIARRYLGCAEFREAGMAARLLVAAPPVTAAQWTDREVPEHVVTDYARVVASLLDLRLDDAGEARCLPLTAAARARFVDYHDQNGLACADAAHGGDDDLAAALAKLRGAAPRIALVLALARAAEAGTAELLHHVEEQAMVSGIEIVRWFEGEARRVYAGWQAAAAEAAAGEQRGHLAALADRLAGELQPGKRCTMRDLHRVLGRNVPAAMVRCALAILESDGRARRCEPERARTGRPAEVWEGLRS